MEQKTLSRYIKTALVFLAAVGAVVYAVIIPTLAVTMRTAYPEFENRFWPWLIFLLLTALPCYAILVFGWLIARNVGKNRSFSPQNALYLKWIAGVAAFLSLYFFAGNAALLLCNMSHPGIALASILFVLTGAAVSIAAAVLARMVTKAAALQEESDLTV